MLSVVLYVLVYVGWMFPFALCAWVDDATGGWKAMDHFGIWASTMVLVFVVGSAGYFGIFWLNATVGSGDALQL